MDYFLLDNPYPWDDELWLIDFPVYDHGNFEHWDSRLVAVYGPGKFREFDYMEGGPDYCVYSPRAQALIEQRFPRQMQFLPFRLQKANGTGEVLGYSVGRPLKVVDCLDVHKTPGRWDELDDGRRRFLAMLQRYILKVPIADQPPIFVEQNCDDTLVSAEFRDVIEQAGLIGFGFRPVEYSTARTRRRK